MIFIRWIPATNCGYDRMESMPATGFGYDCHRMDAGSSHDCRLNNCGHDESIEDCVVLKMDLLIRPT
jgi:hypothetical protein